MKKLLALFIALVMVIGVNLTAIAAPGKFVSSPSGNSAPELIEFSNESEDCDADLVITPYSERHTLPEEMRQKFEEAYKDILEATDLTKLCTALATLAKDKGIPAGDLAISDLFDIYYINCGDHDDHGYFDIVIKPEALAGFVALLHLKNGNWELVKSAKVTNNGTHLAFRVDDFSPFAIVVDTGESSDLPQTGDNSNIALYIVIMVAAAISLVVIWKKSKKQSD
ncbi:MAG: LPXTG cell wall anchor domain-containing protein [Clostridia bacterium]|nr:LPXTG cell wall anchor domain-containing protein [Clostridia bacterium]